MPINRAATHPTRHGRRSSTTWRLIAAVGVCAVLAAQFPGLQAAPVSPELQQRIRATTYEIVVRKVEPSHVTYEKPLPVDLIPFVERNDAYWSIGSAFALAPGVFASAAHVINETVGSPFGGPALRDADGKVYELDRILKYSLEEDFVVFSVRDAPQVIPLDAEREFSRDSPVLAVGNALGEGFIVRDGLLTSTTPEARDGRWSWLRFSAASSPGNSGGPLLDSVGRILGIVIAASPSENLNFALPIARVLDDPGNEAKIEIRAPFGLPIFRDATVSDFRATFELPISYEMFAEHYLATLLDYYRVHRDQLLSEQADSLFPRGESAELLATVHGTETPGLIVQNEDGAWHIDYGENKQDTTLPSGGRVRMANVGNITLFRLQSGTASLSSETQTNSLTFMDELLRALRLPRLVGSQPIRITSLGPAAVDRNFTDERGRPWQLRTWPLGFMDGSLLVATLPAPDGALGMIRLVAGKELAVASDETKFLADYFHLSYSGTLLQWRTFLDARSTRPQLFDSLSWQGGGSDGFRFQSELLDLTVPPTTVSVQDDSTLDLRTTYVMEGDQLAWRVSGLRLAQDGSRKTFLTLNEMPTPPPNSEPRRLTDWNAALRRTGRYTGTPQHDRGSNSYWFRTAVGDATTGLYELVYETDSQLLPRQLTEVRNELLRGMRVGAQ